jgi:hypothetical protein
VVLLAAVVVGFIATYLRARLTGRRLRPIKFKFIWLVFIGVIPQIILFQLPVLGSQIPDALVSITLVASQVTLLAFALLNLKQPGVWVLGLGLLANFLAIVSNGGWMPISPVTVHSILPSLPNDYPLVGRRLGLSKDWVFVPGDINFFRLADRFTTPDWMYYRVAFSLGDILIGIGALLLLWSLSSPEKSEALC